MTCTYCGFIAVYQCHGYDIWEIKKKNLLQKPFTRGFTLVNSPVQLKPQCWKPTGFRPAPSARLPATVGLATRSEVQVEDSSAVQETLPNTRILHALRRKLFCKWCALHHLVHCSGPRELARVLAFLQDLLDTGNSPSALKAHVASMASHWGLINFSLGSKSPSSTPLQKMTS